MRLPAPWRVRLLSVGRLLGWELRSRPLSTAALLAAMAGGLTYACVALAHRAAGDWRVALTGSALPALVAAAVHGARGDARWLRTAGVDTRPLFAAEYGAAALPVTGALAAAGRVVLALATVAAAVAVAWLPAGLGGVWWRARGARPRRRFPLPPDAFEWAAGLRQSGVVLAAAGAGALIAARPGAVLPGAGVVAVAVAGFYTWQHEGWELVAAAGRSPRALLARKTAQAAGLFLVAALPCVAAALAAWALGRGTGVDALAGGAVVAAASLLPAAAVLAKYAGFAPGPRAPVGALLTLLGLSALALFPPALLAAGALLWRAAERRLAPYAHARS